MDLSSSAGQKCPKMLGYRPLTAATDIPGVFTVAVTGSIFQEHMLFLICLH